MSIQEHEPAGILPGGLNGRYDGADEMIRAIRAGEIDALIIGADGRERVQTLGGVDEAYRIFVEAMGEGAVNAALDGTILYCNRRFTELVNCPLEQTIGSSIFRFLEPQEEGTFRAFLWEGGTTASARRDVHLRTTDQKLLPALVTATPFVLEPTNSVCLIFTDLSEHHARLAAETLSQQKDRFFASLSHELRTPLTPVMILIDALSRDGSLPSAVRDDLRVMRENLQVEARLIDDLLELSRVISGKLRVDPVPARGHELVRQVIQMVSADAAARNIAIDPRLQALDDAVHADAARLLQALWNLLKNAIKFSHEGGTVTVRSRNDDGQWVIDVIDRGIGIRADLLPRLFNPFEQGSPCVTQQYGGMGLGLAIAKAVIEQHHGTICARSDGPGTGSVFTIALPLRSGAAAAS